jgi:transposase
MVVGVDGRDARIVELEAQLRRLEALLADAIATRDARIAELEKLLDESRRSGKRQAAPFSKGAPKPEPKRPGRKPGGAHGRHVHRIVPGDPDRVLDAPLPAGCPHCGGQITHVRDADQWQVDLPQLTPTVTRFRVAVGRCGDCGRRVQGRHPEQTSNALGAAGSQVGSHAKAWAIWLHYGLGLSFGKCADVLARLGVNVTAGALCQAAQTTSTDLVPVNNQIVRHVNRSPTVTMDETGWRVAGESSWLWVATGASATVYNVADGRGFAQACDLVDEDYDGVIIRDGWAPYRSYTNATHQTCLAHVLRRCDELITDLPGWARGTPRQVKDLLLDALAARDLGDDARAKAIVDLTERVELLAEQPHPHDECRKLVGHLARESTALFTFLHQPDVDATNWRAEQVIRPAVVNRKVFGGNRTWRGANTQSRIMSVLRTATQQGVDAIEFLTRHARAPTPDTAPPLFT